MSSVRRRPWLIAAAVVVVLLLVGYAARVAGRDTSSATAAPRMHVTAAQWRTDEVARNLAVAFHNDGDVPLVVTRVHLVLPSFTGAGTVDTWALLPVGGLRVDVAVPYGTGTACDASASAPGQVVVDAGPEGGPVSRVTLPLPYPDVLIDRLLRADCQAARAARSVAVGFGAWTSTPDRSLRGTLVVTRVPGADPAAVTVASVGGSTLYTVRADRLGALAAGAPTASFPLTASVADCDAHRIAEQKKPYRFPVQLVLGPDIVPSTVAVTDADRAALDTLLRVRCGRPSAGK